MGEVARPKRTLSSTIRCFFGNSGGQERLLPQRAEEESEPVIAPEPKTAPEPFEVEESLIIYEGNPEVRPPVLPILPVQRLRLLRQKQEWRRRHVLELVNNSPLQLNILNYPYKSSSTPSPVKEPPALKKLPLKKKKLSKGTGKGTKWSGDLEYDLAEYDTTDNRKTTGHDLPLNTVTNYRTTTPQNINSDQLSATQRNVLLKGQQPAVRAALPPIKSHKETPTNKGEKVVLPSVGFDFIKGSDTPSKVKTLAQDDDEEEPKRKKRIVATPIKDEANMPCNSGDNKQTEKKTEAQKPLFSFGQKKGETQAPAINIEQNKESQTKPAFSFGQNKDEKPKPAFSFGQKEGSQPKPSFDFGQKKSEQAKPAFNFGQKEDSQPKPSFDFGQKKSEQAKPAFSFGQKENGETKPSFELGQEKVESPKPAFSFDPKKDDKPKPSIVFDQQKGEQSKSTFSFGQKDDGHLKPASSTDEKTNDQTKPVFSFGEKKDDETKLESSLDQKKNDMVKPTFSFGQKKDEQPKPAFSFGPAPNEKRAITSGNDTNETEKSKPAFSERTEDQPKPVFSFGAKSDEAKQQDKNDAKPLFSFGSGASSSSTASFTFGGKNESTLANAKPDLSSNQKPDESKQDTKGFSFDRIRESAPAGSATGQTNVPSFKFGASVNDKPVTNGPSVFAPTPKIADKPFSFSKPNTNAPWSAGSSTATTGSTTPSFNFKFGAGSNTQPAPVASNNPPINNPFVNKPSGFSFNNGNGGGDGGALNLQPAQAPGPVVPSVFGNSHSVSPAFGKSTSPPTMPNSNPSSRAFTPSNTINLNFGNVGPADPSTIFSGGGANRQAGPMGTPSPQQVLGGGSQPPAQIFGGSVGPQPFGNGFGAGAGTGMTANPSQSAITNFQLPPGRKLARMRQSRRG